MVIREGGGFNRRLALCADLGIMETGRGTDEDGLEAEDGPVFSSLHNICCRHIYYS